MTALLLVVVAVAAALFGAGLDELVHHLAGRLPKIPTRVGIFAKLAETSRATFAQVGRRLCQVGGAFRRTARRVKARFVHTGRHTERQLRKIPQLSGAAS